MAENEKVTAFEKKLIQLKEEEKMIVKILKDVQNQLKKYEVEELQTSSELVSCRRREEEEEDEDSESDESVDGKPESLLKILDSAELVNDASLNLNLNKIFGNDDEDDESEESEEFEESS